MLRLVLFLVAVAALASGLSWLADRPGTLLINWQGYEIETSVFRAIVMLALLLGLSILLWSILVQMWRSPASLGAFFMRRRHSRGLEALSSGMIAIGSGDRAQATRFAVQARKALPNEPLTHLLRAQAAELSGDRATARRIFEAMLTSPETEQLGLRGLFLEAEREGEREAARQFAERAARLNPKLAWSVDALFELQCKERDWQGALETLAVAKRHQHHDKAVLDRRRAVLLAARAQEMEESEPDRAMALALEAHHLAHDLIPAAAIAGRILAARGNTKRAAKVVERTWRYAPHPDLATAYAHARIGDSPRDRLDRVKRLAQLNPHSIETPIAIATAAVEARDWGVARRALEPLTEARMTQRVCTLMARVESEELGDKGRVREWLARAVHAPRDAAWTADGVVSDRWGPVSPVTGTLDAFQWRVPVEALETADTAALTRKLEEIIRLGMPEAPALGAAGADLDGREDRATVTAAAGRSPPGRNGSGHTADAPGAAETMTARPITAVPVEIVATAPTPVRAAAAAERSQSSAAPGPAARPAPAEGTGARSGGIKSTEAHVTIEPAGKAAETAAASAPVATLAAARGPGGQVKGAAPTRQPGVAATDAAATGPGAKEDGARRDRAGADPSVYIMPRVPDDPGIEPVEARTDRRESPVRAVSSSKR